MFKVQYAGKSSIKVAELDVKIFGIEIGNEILNGINIPVFEGIEQQEVKDISEEQIIAY